MAPPEHRSARVLAAAEVGRDDLALAGGKAVQLAALGESGARVPPWFVITTAGFEAALVATGPQAAAGLRATIDAPTAGWTRGRSIAPEERSAAAGAIRAALSRLEPPAELRAEVARLAAATFAGEPFLAVRSSAAAEDAAGDSFAGVHESRLFVRGEEPFWTAVRAVWASAFQDRALAYRLERGLPLSGLGLAVVVQEMVEARSSAVLFTADPLDGDTGRMVLSALWGAGEGLVSAGLDADTFRIEKDGLEISAELADKRERFVLDRGRGGGLVREPVPEELRGRPCLADGEVAEAARLGLALERRFRRPQDLELCWDGEGRLHVVQARPVTTVEELGPAAGNRLLWDNSNIVESYSGVTSPMTFSFIRRAYTIVYRNFADVMGIPPRVVEENAATFENMLGYLRGRVYYNLRNWYRVVRLFPGYERNRAFMESMMGVRESARFEDEATPAGATAVTVAPPPRSGSALLAAARMGLRFLRIDGIVGGFERHFASRYRVYAAIDFERLAPHQLEALYREMERELLQQWKAPIVNDFFVMVLYGTLKKLCVAWCGDEAGTLQNDLICGEGGIASTEPAKRMLALARAARTVPELEALFRERPAAELAASLPEDPRFRPFAAEVASYLGEFGFRCMDELKLEEPPLRDRPAFLYQMVANYLAGDPAALDASQHERREHDVRARAEERAARELRERAPFGAATWRRWVFRRVLAGARRGVRNRENLRFARTKVYGLLRDLLRAVGGHLAEAGAIRERQDVFLLTLDEVWDYGKGTAVTTRLAELVELRRSEMESHRAAPAPDDRFETFGLVPHRNLFRARRTAAAAAGAADGVLRGVGCSPGVVEGPVKVLRSPAEARLDGEILVAERTDPGWVPLFPSASGLLVERGSILSHSAIVAREMGLPTIVGLVGLTARVATGDRVRMDGAAGTVEVPPRSAPES